MRDVMSVALNEPITFNENAHTRRYGFFGGVVRDSIRFDNGMETVLVPIGDGFPNVTDRNGFTLGSPPPPPLE